MSNHKNSSYLLLILKQSFKKIPSYESYLWAKIMAYDGFYICYTCKLVMHGCGFFDLKLRWRHYRIKATLFNFVRSKLTSWCGKNPLFEFEISRKTAETHTFFTLFLHIFVFFKICLHFCLFFSVFPVFVYIWKIDLVGKFVEFEGFLSLYPFKIHFKCNKIEFAV